MPIKFCISCVSMWLRGCMEIVQVKSYDMKTYVAMILVILCGHINMVDIHKGFTVYVATQ